MSARGRAESAAGLPLGGGEQRKGMVMDTGMAHKRGTSERVMYRGPDLPFGNVPLGETPMAVWPASAARLQAAMRRTESVWRNPAAVAAWRAAKAQQPLFGDEAVLS